MGNVVLARHGATAGNRNESTGQEYVRGWDDFPLNQRGHQEAIALANQIAKKYNVKMIFCSDLSRARQTAEHVGRKTGAGVYASEGLRTWNLGDLTGKPVQQVLSAMRYYEDHPAESPPNGESKDNFRARLTKELWTGLNEARRSKHDVLFLTHGRCISETPAIVGGTKALYYTECPGTGALMELTPGSKGRWKMNRL